MYCQCRSEAGLAEQTRDVLLWYAICIYRTMKCGASVYLATNNVLVGGMMKKPGKSTESDYGISRYDDDIRKSHGWRVSLLRRGNRLVENFPDKKHGGRQKALKSAQRFRDELLEKFPPISRIEVCQIRRSNNTSGISGVCTYAKSYKLKDGTIRETRYWEATWPTQDGKNASVNFSVRKFGEEMARSMAIRARLRGLEGVEGPFWVSERGLINATDKKQNISGSQKPVQRVA